MSPILGILASSRLAAVGDYESIQTYTVGAGGSSSITFSSIPSTYTHLQIRVFGQSNRGTYGNDDCWLQVGNGSVDTATNYSYHILSGDGATAIAGAATSTSRGYWGYVGTGVSSTFGAAIIDVLDYANTNKYKTIRTLNGQDQNGIVASYGGAFIFASSNWRSTLAINTIKLYPNSGTQFNQYSSFALYGIK